MFKEDLAAIGQKLDEILQMHDKGLSSHNERLTALEQNNSGGGNNGGDNGNGGGETPNPPTSPGEGYMMWTVGPAGNMTNWINNKQMRDNALASKVSAYGVHMNSSWYVWCDESQGRPQQGELDNFVDFFGKLSKDTGKKFLPLVTIAGVSPSYPLYKNKADFPRILDNETRMLDAAYRTNKEVILDKEPYLRVGGWFEFYNPSVQGSGLEIQAYEIGAMFGERYNKLFPGLTVYWNHGFYQTFNKPNAEVLHLNARGVYPSSFWYNSFFMAGMMNAAPALNWVNSLQTYALWTAPEMKRAMDYVKSEVKKNDYCPISPDVKAYEVFKTTMMIYNQSWSPAVGIGRTMTAEQFQKSLRELMTVKDSGTYAVGYAETGGLDPAAFWNPSGRWVGSL